MTLLAIAYLLLSSVIAIHFGSCLVGRDRIAFRDASHFYTPLYAYVADRQQSEWLPLWNPLDLTGIPLAGETTTAVFYPVRILVYSLCQSSETALAWYVAVHLLIAALTMHMAARSVGAGPVGCAVAVIAYPLSGPIFFLVFNPPFLVGAAWLPLLLAGGFRLVHKPDPFWLVVVSLAVAMMVLGGDPQTAINAMLVGAVYVFVNLCRHWAGGRELRQGAISSLTMSVLLGAAIAAPQLIATADWSLQSGRLRGETTNARDDFSVPPWHWIELIIPEASGRLFPVNSRISQLLPGDGRVWVVTLSSGLVLLILVVNRYLAQPWRVIDLWDCLVLIGLLFAMSGVYHYLSYLVPGYAAFRYPGKWLPFFPAGVAVVAARQVDSLLRFPTKSLEHLCLAFTGFCLLCGTVSIAFLRFGATVWVNNHELSDRFWGPLQSALACEIIAISAMKSAAISSTLWALFRFIRLRNERDHESANRSLLEVPFYSQVAPFLLLILVASDMYIISVPQVAKVNRTHEAELLGSINVEDEQPLKGQRSMRMSTGAPWPREWRESDNGTARLLEVEVSQRATQFGRWHLAEEQAMFNSATSISPRRIALFWMAINGDEQSEALTLHSSEWARLQRWLAIDRELRTVSNIQVKFRGATTHLSQSKQANVTGVPFYVWDSDYRSIELAHDLTVEEMRERIIEVIAADKDTLPYVEDNLVGRSRKPAGSLEPAKVQVLSESPERIVLDVECSGQGLLTWKSFQDGHWHALLTPLSPSPEEATDETTLREVHRVDYLFMGVKIPPGRWEVEFYYWPWWMTLSLVISGASCLLVVSILVKLVKGHSA